MPLTLLVLAAGMGSRYGGLKQLDPVGPAGETLLDYSVFDALRAGFDRVVFVIRHDFEAEFRRRVGASYEKLVEVAYVFQELTALPAGFTPAPGRVKPLGTGHAIWCAREQVRTPFAAINADDFYGAAAYRTLGDFFARGGAAGEPASFAMVAYRLGQTLSEHGRVSRGVCAVDADGRLETVREFTGIENTPEGARHTAQDGTVTRFSGREMVSMNFWGLTPAVFALLERGLRGFLLARGKEEAAEYYIPSAMTGMIEQGSATVAILPSESQWFGVTYREDKAAVMAALERLVAAGVYPASLWDAGGRK
jgi:NDP-sugar pyrophosphorylase family protein